MKKNIGQQDKMIRLILAFILLLLVWFNKIHSMTLQIVVLTFALLLAVTSYLDYCFLYALFGFSTDKNKSGSK
jgi:hypothetical protein